MSSIHGHCYCGEIEFTVDDDCVPTRTLYCHCESCRRAHSAPLYQIIYMPEEYFHIIKGNEYIKHYSKNPLENSIIRSFCSNCGSRIFNKLPKRPELGVGVFPCLFDENIQHNLPEKFIPNKHHLHEEAVINLCLLNDNIPRL